MRTSLIGHSDRCSDRKRCRAEQETVPRPIVPDNFANDMGGSSGQVFGVACEVRNRILRNITRLGGPFAQILFHRPGKLASACCRLCGVGTPVLSENSIRPRVAS
jgi:hypothetical protein